MRGPKSNKKKKNKKRIFRRAQSLAENPIAIGQLFEKNGLEDVPRGGNLFLQHRLHRGRQARAGQRRRRCVLQLQRLLRLAQRGGDLLDVLVDRDERQARSVRAQRAAKASRCALAASASPGRAAAAASASCSSACALRFRPSTHSIPTPSSTRARTIRMRFTRIAAPPFSPVHLPGLERARKVQPPLALLLHAEHAVRAQQAKVGAGNVHRKPGQLRL